MKKLSVILLLPVCALMACGGGGGSSVNTGGSGGASCTSAVAPAAPRVVTVVANQTVTNTNIAVACQASTPTPNSEDLGVGATVNGTTASNSGAQIAQGATMSVILFGPGLSGNMTISISGPNDITVSNPTTIRSTNNLPGIAFTAVVSPSAALGARTVVLQDANHDVTTFTGGLEVIP
ncbi:MAG TPA: hypothetical protein VE994_14905 [Terriglobales bacterium]|nr:hypothetical protein [Terriglobales bacterium]